MTLVVRTRINTILIIVATIILAVLVMLNISSIRHRVFSVPKGVQYTIIVLSIYTLAVTSIIALISIRLQFEKTQPVPLAYILCFVAACFLEEVRLLTPIFNLWKATQVSIIIARVILFARFLTPLSLLFASIYNKASQRQYTFQNIIIILIASAFVASIFPLDTMHPNPLGYIDFALNKTLTVTRYILFVLAILCQLVDYIQNTTKYSFPYALTLLSTGYITLCKTQTLSSLVIGTVAFVLGGILYLVDLHRQTLAS